jgi:hypothetical protein
VSQWTVFSKFGEELCDEAESRTVGAGVVSKIMA